MPGLIKIFIVCCISLAFSSTALAEIYSYRDDAGRLSFVDDKDKIPTRYQERTSTVPESKQALGDYVTERPDESIDISTIETDLKPPEKRTRKDSAYQTPVTINGNRVLIPAEVTVGNRSRELILLLDTGATATVFHRTALAGLELPKGRTYKARIAGGGIVKSKKMLFRKFNVGPFQMENHAAMVINLKGREVPFDGMLGMDFIKKHPHQIDFEKQIIQWQKP
jgi:hypothetical protein